MTALRSAVDALINRAEAGAADPAASAEDMLLYAKTLEAVGPTSAVGFINATSEAQNTRVLATGDEQNARVISTGDSEVLRVKNTMGTAVGVLKSKGDLLIHDGSGAARVPIGVAGQMLVTGANGVPVWGAAGKVRNIAHYAFSDVTRTTWSGYGNIINGSDFYYKPLKDDSKLLIQAELVMCSNGSWSGANIMWCPTNSSNAATDGWRYGAGDAGERYNNGTPAAPVAWNPWATYGGYFSQFGNTYCGIGWDATQKYNTTMLIDLRKVATFDAAQGHKIHLAMTCHAQGSWFTINESYNQSNYPARYSQSGFTVWELAPTANTDAE